MTLKDILNIERKEYKDFYTEGSVSLAEKEEIVERKIEYY